MVNGGRKPPVNNTIISSVKNMEKSKMLAIITGAIFLVDCIFPSDVAMGVVLCMMGGITIFTTWKEWPKNGR